VPALRGKETAGARVTEQGRNDERTENPDKGGKRGPRILSFGIDTTKGQQAINTTSQHGKTKRRRRRGVILTKKRLP